MSTREIGDRGEALAAAYLEKQGYRILERNYRFERAEVDLVCFEPAARYEEGGDLVFVEVKTRTGLGYGRPEEAVSEAKRRSLIKAAEAYLHEHRMDGMPCRFDVVSVLLGEGEPQIEHFKDAFWKF
ncbi:YraN family protein [Rhodocaloribacter litoris]|uniref:YraN family protein n=1 Tax=Rhodocaloribacter litoris TaxID=2558931 RepID=UPI00141F9A70|nr:YraN family protein [Rhodocaloribacter litoris]QXD14916.1 YraN family protein [Rhodocaloribacter litoris]